VSEQKITPFFWFDGNAEDAVRFYVSTFKDAKMGEIARYGEEGPGPEGSDGGETMQCGWLRDKFGVTWQIVPSEMPNLIDRTDPERASRVMQAMFKMVKLDLGALRAAYENRDTANAGS